MKVIGVVKDYNFESLKSTIRPMVLLLSQPPNWGVARAFFEGQHWQSNSNYWKRSGSSLRPTVLLNMRSSIRTLMQSSRQSNDSGNVILVFTTLAIFIACLGLFGLATFTAEQRSKENQYSQDTRRDVSQLVVLLSRDFVKLILISLVIAIPITWYGINQWLEGFAYRVNFSFTLVLVSGMVALLIALLTVSFQSIKAALGNPVDSLKSE